jgi:citronellol/citronellal dehydrogenase
MAGQSLTSLPTFGGGMPHMAHSGAARAGMLSFTETVACEWAHAGVRVNAVAPGWIASSGFDTYSPEVQKEMRGWKKKVPLQRFGTEAEISAAIVFSALRGRFIHYWLLHSR